MTVSLEGLAAPVARYAGRLHARLGSVHHVASPLGAWLLLALVGRVSTGATRAEITDALGIDVDTAGRAAAALFERPHPVVSSAAAVWHAPDAVTAELRRWVETLPAAVDVGDLPSQTGADAWAVRHTRGLIDRFPLGITADAVLILASALAARLSWRRPYQLLPANRLGPASPWVDSLATVLAAPEGGDCWQFIADADGIGPVGVHVAADADRRLRVVSVIAAPDLPSEDVLAAAHRIAAAVADDHAPTRSLFDLPLGDGPAWTITERPLITTAMADRVERCTAVLPAWSASSDHDLTHDAALGFPAAAHALAALLHVPAYFHEVKQSALARYTREGFEAAAVTAVGMRVSASIRGAGVRRDAELRFGHPYAVVAVAADKSYAADAGAVVRGPWHGLPVFSAWVAAPEDAAAN